MFLFSVNSSTWRANEWLLSIKCKIIAIWMVETDWFGCIFMIFLTAAVQISMECEAQEILAGL